MTPYLNWLQLLITHDYLSHSDVEEMFHGCNVNYQAYVNWFNEEFE